MEILTAPWRREYITGEKKEGCVFCTAQKSGDDKKEFILYRGKHVFVIMNIYPYNTGHIMITPYRHLPCLSELSKDEILEFSVVVQKSIGILRTAMTPDGFNTGSNIGKSAGAGVVDHVHTHIVPRWNGDTNFMPICAGTKVLSEDLNTTYQNLLTYFKSIPLV